VTLSARLRHRVEFQAQVVTQDSDGETDLTWSTAEVDGLLLDCVPAEVLTGPGREFFAADSKRAQAVARITVRWFPGLSAAWRVVWEGRTFNIESIETDATARRDLRLRCSEGVNDGR
jgi:head-tail adaptor